jgi:hypothetical protein
LAARTHTYAERGRPNHRATLSLIFGLVAALALPVGIELTRKVSGAALLDAAWAIPVAAVASVAALTFERGARGTVIRALDRAGGSRRLKAARVLVVTGICFTLSSSIAVAIYEFLVSREHTTH